MALFNREPAVIIGIVAACTLAVIQTLAGEGIIGADVADTVSKAIDPAGGWLLPIVLGIITRFVVFSPATAQKLRDEVPPGYVPAGEAVG